MRTKYCGNIQSSDIGEIVIICGWVNRKRNFRNFIFIDVRDRTGIIQVFCDLKKTSILKQVSKLKNEFCIQVFGKVQSRSTKNQNHNMHTGNIEIFAHKINIFSQSNPLPIDINSVNDDKVRLKYRYLDLRRPEMMKNITIRSNITDCIRNFMKQLGFLNIETPMLIKSTPDGAKDYLIPSRIHDGKYYALPQSPQLFKQLLMISGFDKYYQIAKCFRDEDLRSDRQPEFTQIDIEASFMNGQDIRNIVEKMIKKLWKKILNYNFKNFSILSFHDAITQYGSDKPDLRNPIKLINIKKFITCSNIENNKYDILNNIVAFVIPKGLIHINEIEIKKYNNIIQQYSYVDHMYVTLQDHHFKKTKNVNYSNIFKIKNMLDIINTVSAESNDIICILSGKSDTIYNIFHKLRKIIWEKINSSNRQSWEAVWIIDFPLFQKDQNNNLISVHHPFTAPKNDSINLIKNNPESELSKAYDLVINGYEIGGGSDRIYNSDMQKTIFEILGIPTTKTENPLSFFIKSLQYGTPPHAGIALGLDRIAMLLTNNSNMKNVIAFPKTNTATCLMTDAPSKLIY